MFTHLYVQSGFSLMDSTVKIDTLARRAKELGYDAAALTDSGVLHGTIPFVKACQQQGIRPIIGMTVDLTAGEGTERVILLAKNNAGYGSLIRLSTHIQTHEEQLNGEQLAGLTDGLIGILPVYGSQLGRMLSQESFNEMEVYAGTWKERFQPGDFYIGVDAVLMQNSGLQRTLRSFLEFAHIGAAALHEVRYLDRKDADAFHCLQAMKASRKYTPGQSEDMAARHFASPEELAQTFAAWPGALDETERIAAKCRVELDFDRQMLPSYPVSGDKTAHQYLTEICEQRLQTFYGPDNRQAKERMQYELGIIEKMKFSDYFLIVWDFVDYAKREQILVGPGRGSAAGSLVAYILGITEVDPLEYHLLFERFLNPERVTMPDIDIDFSDQRRDEVIAYVQQKYGKAHVAQIITFGTFAPRSLIRELVKTLEISEQDMYFILKEMSKLGSLPILDYVRQSEDLKSYVAQSVPLQQLFRIAAKLEGLPRHISTHAAGVVISEEPLVTHVPLIPGSGDIYLTQYPMNDLEAIGLLKMDFLGLRNLTMIERITRSVRYAEQEMVDIGRLPEQDEQTYRLLQEGRTNGIFQLESAGMKRVLTELKPTEFNDIVAVNALYRPGPMEYIPKYIKRKHGQEEITYPHPDLEPILKDTYGVLVYQEQIMQIAHAIAGFSLGRADILRRAVSKKKKEAIDEQREAFVKGCLKKGYNAPIAEEIFEWIVRFSNYGFNKSHAVAYSKIAYQLAYLKAHYPASFFAELMSSTSGHHDKLAAYMKEAKGIGLRVMPPSVNHSFGFFTAENGHIRMGFNAIKGVGQQVAKEIIRVRKEGGPFRDLFQFCLRVDMKLINRASIESLIMAGAFDDLYPNRATMLASIDGAMEQGELFGDFDDQQNLFKDELEANYTVMEDFSQVKKLHDEKELLGVYMSSHPLKTYRDRLHASGFIPLKDTADHSGKRNMQAAAVLQSLKVIRTKRGDPMAFLTLSDETEEAEAVMFPELYRNTNRFLEEEMLVFVKGKVELRKGQAQWILDDIAPFAEEQLQKAAGKLFIKLTDRHEEREALAFLKQLAHTEQGMVPVIIYHEGKKQTYQLQHAYALNAGEQCLGELERYFGKGQVVFSK